MMARIDRTKRTAPARADSYPEVGRRLLYAARAITEQGDARHANALAMCEEWLVTTPRMPA